MKRWGKLRCYFEASRGITFLWRLFYVWPSRSRCDSYSPKSKLLLLEDSGKPRLLKEKVNIAQN
jgi:hypothetical protein